MTELSVRPFDMFLNQLGDVLDTRNLRGLVWFRRLRVFIDAGNIGPITLSIGFGARGVAGVKDD